MSNPYDNRIAKNASILGPTLKFKGDLTANEDLLIQGQIEGTITHTSSLTIGKEGKLKANVTAEYISIEGEVDGELVGSKSVVVKESANVQGNIYSPTVTLREGSTFNGQIDMTGKKQPQSLAPEAGQQDAAESNSKSDDPKQDYKKREATGKKSDSDKKRSASAA